MCYTRLASTLERARRRLRRFAEVLTWNTRGDLLRYDYNLRNILRTRMIPAPCLYAIDLPVNIDVKAGLSTPPAPALRPYDTHYAAASRKRKEKKEGDQLRSDALSRCVGDARDCLGNRMISLARAFMTRRDPRSLSLAGAPSFSSARPADSVIAKEDLDAGSDDKSE